MGVIKKLFFFYEASLDVSQTVQRPLNQSPTSHAKFPGPQSTGGMENHQPAGHSNNRPEEPPLLSHCSETPTTAHVSPTSFTFEELASATDNFRPEFMLSEESYGKLYRGCLPNSEQLVAVKLWDPNGPESNRGFLVEVQMLNVLHHPNLAALIGYCAEGTHRLTVNEFMPMGSLHDHLFGVGVGSTHEPLDWNTRIKIAAGVAKGLDYLHNKASPPVIYRSLNPKSILLDECFHPKLSNFGLAKLLPSWGKTHMSNRVVALVGTCGGYIAPEYMRNGELTLKSDVYTFGIVLLQLITGRKATDRDEEHGLHYWAISSLLSTGKSLSEIADPRLQGAYPMRSLSEAVRIATLCLLEDAAVRPSIGDVVIALESLLVSTATPSTRNAE